LLSANIRTSNLPNLLIIGIRGTQFVSCIYRVPVSIFVPLIIPLRREPCTTSPNCCINAHITWLDNSHGASFIVIFVTCFSTSTNFIYLFLISIPLVNRMCLVLGSKTVKMQLFLLFVWTVFKKILQVFQFLL
jgi:hypothetical protein